MVHALTHGGYIREDENNLYPTESWYELSKILKAEYFGASSHNDVTISSIDPDDNDKNSAKGCFMAIAIIGGLMALVIGAIILGKWLIEKL